MDTLSPIQRSLQRNPTFNKRFIGLIRVPDLHLLIWDYPTTQAQRGNNPTAQAQRFEIRWTYLNIGTYQFHMERHSYSEKADHPPQFQFEWFKIFFDWLEYSLAKDVVLSFMLSFKQETN